MMNSYYWFNFEPIVLLEVTMYIGLCFHNEDMNSAHIAIHSSNSSTSWSDWSEEKEIERKETHDIWLLKNIGKPPYVYSW
ncbi:MAG: hypothetical protein ACYDG2_03750, partial [Ruminiclostridium sp.]